MLRRLSLRNVAACVGCAASHVSITSALCSDVVTMSCHLDMLSPDVLFRAESTLKEQHAANLQQQLDISQAELSDLSGKLQEAQDSKLQLEQEVQELPKQLSPQQQEQQHQVREQVARAPQHVSHAALQRVHVNTTVPQHQANQRLNSTALQCSLIVIIDVYYICMNSNTLPALRLAVAPCANDNAEHF